MKFSITLEVMADTFSASCAILGLLRIGFSASLGLTRIDFYSVYLLGAFLLYVIAVVDATLSGERQKA